MKITIYQLFFDFERFLYQTVNIFILGIEEFENKIENDSEDDENSWIDELVNYFHSSEQEDEEEETTGVTSIL